MQIDSERLRQNAADIAARTRVPVYAVVKANAYGLGASRIAEALAPAVAGWCVFSLTEARDAQLWQRTGKGAIALGPPETLDPQPWIDQHVRPAVSTVEQAAALRRARPVLCVDTGMQRFACPEENIAQVIAAGNCEEAFTHAPSMRQVERLLQLVGNRGLLLHAAASSLLDEPRAWLNAVRPGLALYRDAVRVSTPLREVKHARGPVGYGAFPADRFGVILCGYANGLRLGPCAINGQIRRILEVGMQSAYVEVSDADRIGDEVVLLGEPITPELAAQSWRCTPHEVIVRLAAMG